MDIKKVIGKIRSISFIAIIFIMAFVGIYFILQVDSLIESRAWLVYDLLKDPDASQVEAVGKSKALCLMIVILLSFGSACASAFSEQRKDLPILVYCLKGLAIVLAVVLIVFVSGFETTYLAERVHSLVSTTKVVSLAFTYIGIGTIVINIASNAYLGIEE